MVRAARKESRRKRVVWVTVVVVFLGIATLLLWVFVRTQAKTGYGDGRFEHDLGEGESLPEVAEEGVPAVLWSAYPSPFRSSPDREEGEGTEPPQAPEASAEGGLEAVTAGEEIVYHSRKNDRMEIALSFDDGPHPRLTPIILEILEEYGIKATFFMVGENVGYYPDTARAVAEAGHEIGNHTFSHRRFSRMSEGEMMEEISSCEKAISGIWGHPVHYVRPPEGQMNETVRRVAGSLDYRIILWDVDTRDWAHTPPEEITRHILNTVQSGDIILMHDFIGYNSPTPAALRMVIPALLERGFSFVTVGELVEGQGSEQTDG